MNKLKQTKKKKKGIGKKILLVLVLLLLVIGGIFAYKVHKNGGGLKGLLATAVGHDQMKQLKHYLKFMLYYWVKAKT